MIVVIEVSGGCVTNVRNTASIEGVTYHVVDYDNKKDDPKWDEPDWTRLGQKLYPTDPISTDILEKIYP